ncbi:MAG TPA: PHP domain-containing protein [Anaerolineae bacterium]|nr:PHP domain-containing protein [Anaerolineae bacterium]
MLSKYPKGSEWRKWDLHIHSIYSRENRAKLEIKDIFNNAITKNVAVIAITDHSNVDGLDEIWSVWENEKTENGDNIKDVITFFPGVELKASSGERGVHFLVVFPPYIQHRISHIQKVDKDFLINSFLSKIDCAKSDVQNSGDGSYDKGLFQIAVDLEKTAQLAHKLGGLIIVHNGNKDHGFDQEIAHPADSADEKELLNTLGPYKEKLMKECVDICEFPNWNSYHQNEAKFYLEKFNKSSVVFSDSHDQYLLNTTTWIKADPTFEGFKQILFEPIERVCIQDLSPQIDFPKPFFSRIIADAKIINNENITFNSADIPLNPNLVSIIGGRGTGKSILLDCLYKTFHSGEERNIDDNIVNINPTNFKVDYEKSDGEIIHYNFSDKEPLSYLHVRQGEIKQIVKNPEQLSKHIKNLLRISIEEDVPKYEYDLSNLLEKIISIKSWFITTDTDGNIINSEEYNNKRIKENKSLIKTITTDKNKKLIEDYKKNSISINNKEILIKRLEELQSTSENYKAEIERLIKEINESGQLVSSLPNIDFSPLETSIQKSQEKLTNEINKLKGNNKNIVEEFKNQGIDQDISGLLTKVNQYQGIIDKSVDKINEIKRKTEELEKRINNRVLFKDNINSDLTQQKKNVDRAFTSLKEGPENWSQIQKSLVKNLLKDIQIYAQINFNVGKFYDGLSGLLNGQKFRSTATHTQLDRIKAKIKVDSYESFLKLIGNEKIISDNEGKLINLDEFALNDDFFLKDVGFDMFEYLYLSRYRIRYLTINAVIEYKGKKPEKLSVGQRGTFYICMKLATDPFGSPFVFDQPEDDLDNEFIMEDLVPLFKEIKKYRQVIIATHNANLVVNADAEQVIVANNTDEVLSYRSGSLEHTDRKTKKGIREEVCRILEGGETAFEKRELKYGFSKTNI